MRVTVVGKNGFLGHALAKLPDAKNWTFLTHEEALGETDWIPKTDILINCAYHPDFMKGEYSPIKDIDFMLSGYIQNSGIHYVMISSRAVYGPAPDNLYLTEDMPPAPECSGQRAVWWDSRQPTHQDTPDLLDLHKPNL